MNRKLWWQRRQEEENQLKAGMSPEERKRYLKREWMREKRREQAKERAREEALREPSLGGYAARCTLYLTRPMHDKIEAARPADMGLPQMLRGLIELGLQKLEEIKSEQAASPAS